jgi:multisubunit Na+/H+ antiporter MnhB subunit
MGHRRLTVLRLAAISLILFLLAHGQDAQAQPAGEAVGTMRRVSAAVLIWGMLAIASVSLIVIGGGWLIVRFGRRIRSRVEEKRVRTKYFDISVRDLGDEDTAEDGPDDGPSGRE